MLCRGEVGFAARGFHRMEFGHFGLRLEAACRRRGGEQRAGIEVGLAQQDIIGVVVFFRHDRGGDEKGDARQREREFGPPHQNVNVMSPATARLGWWQYLSRLVATGSRARATRERPNDFPHVPYLRRPLGAVDRLEMVYDIYATAAKDCIYLISPNHQRDEVRFRFRLPRIAVEHPPVLLIGI
jgi:hypothetical protein